MPKDAWGGVSSSLVSFGHKVARRGVRGGSEEIGIIERFTRDRVSRYVWGGLTVAVAAALVLSVLGSRRSVREERTAAAQRAIAYVSGALDAGVRPDLLNAPITGAARDGLQFQAQQTILTDPRVARVRIWALDGRLLFSTDPGDHVGSSEAFNDRLISAVTSGRAAPKTVIAGSFEGAAIPPEIQTYAPVRPPDVATPAAAAEIDESQQLVVAGVVRAWAERQLALSVLALFVALMTVASFREPLMRIGIGVPFTRESIPDRYALVEVDQLREVESVVTHAKERAARIEERLLASEEARRGLEGELQRTLSKAVLGAKRPRPTPKILDRIKASGPEPAAPTNGITSVRPSGRAVKPEPEPRLEIVEQPEVVKQPEVVEITAPEPAPEPEPHSLASVAEPEIAEIPESEVLDVSRLIDLPEPTDDAWAFGEGAWERDEDLGSAGALEPATEDDSSAREMLMRMVEPVEVPTHVSELNPDLRTRLARTAARKKPGRREPRHDESGDAPPAAS